MCKSGIPRVVFRKTNKYVIAEYTTSKATQDKIELGTTSKVLLMHGLPKELSGSLKSTPAVYLTGFYLEKKFLRRNCRYQ